MPSRPTSSDASVDGSSWSFSAASRRAVGAISREVLSSSDQLGWTSVLVDHHVIRPMGQDFSLPGTPDYTLIAILGGGQEVGAWCGAGWRWTTYTAGMIELTSDAQGRRLRRRPLSGSSLVEKVNIYLPERGVAEVGEHYRRAGRPPRRVSRRGEVQRDTVVVEMARRVSDAVARGAPELYGEAVAVYLATHLLALDSGGAHELNARRRPQTLTRRRVFAVADLIKSHYAEPLTLDRLAAEAQTSKFHFIRQFRDATGTTPHAYLLAVRLDAARHLIRFADLSVSQIAARCGFAQPSHFTAAYTARFGVPPTRDRADAAGPAPNPR